MRRMLMRRVSRPIAAYESVFDGVIKPVYNIRKGNPKAVAILDVDQFSGQKFMMNPQGFIMNDIMVFEEAQSDQVARAVLSRIKVLHPESINQDLSPDEMFASIIPANYGSPAEFVAANKSVVSRLYDLRSKMSNAAAESAAREMEIKQDAAIKEVQVMEGAIPKSE